MQDKHSDHPQSEADAMLEQLLRETDHHLSDLAEEEAPAADKPIPEPEASAKPDEPLTAPTPEVPEAKEDVLAVTPRKRSLHPTDSDLFEGETVRKAEQENEVIPTSGRTVRTRTEDKKPSRKKKRKYRTKTNLSFVLIWLTVVVSVAVILGTVVIALGKDMYAIGKDDTTKKTVEIASGASTAQIAEQLYDEGIIRVPKLFRLVSKLRGADAKYIAGEHVVSPGMAYEELITELTTAIDVETVSVTFKEGITLHEAAQMLEEAEVCKADRFIFFFNAGGYGFDFESKLPATSDLKFYQREGYLFPDTYEFYVEMDPELVCQKIYKNFNSKMSNGTIDDLGMTYYQRIDDLGVSMDYIITLASVIQAEASNVSSMRGVSSVFWNRLNHKDQYPLLQSDPTRKYVEDIIQKYNDVPNDVINQAYNTYEGQGLPPGAICNPGIDAIEAALNPALSDNYFFCANVNTKAVYYAKTNEEHEANLAKIQQEYASAQDAQQGEEGAAE